MVGPKKQDFWPRVNIVKSLLRMNVLNDVTAAPFLVVF